MKPKKDWITKSIMKSCSTKEIVHCATRGELFLARVRGSARVGVEGTESARDRDEC